LNGRRVFDSEAITSPRNLEFVYLGPEEGAKAKKNEEAELPRWKIVEVELRRWKIAEDAAQRQKRRESEHKAQDL